MYSVFEYYSNNILFVFVFGHNSEPEYYSYSYSYSAKYLCTNIIRIRIRSFWKNEYYSYSYSVQNLIPNIIRIRIRSKKQYSLTSVPKQIGWDKWLTNTWEKSWDAKENGRVRAEEQDIGSQHCSKPWEGWNYGRVLLPKVTSFTF